MKSLDLFKKRRTQYALNKKLPLSHSEIQQLVFATVREAPSAFNSQSSRIVILFDEQHNRLWNELVKEVLRGLTTPAQFEITSKKLAGFAAAAGTILFYEDTAVIKSLQERFPSYADNFPEFSAHSAGMAQFAVWSALAEADIGASLQHYNPVIDAPVRQAWDIPATWRLCAQMPFGGHAAAIAPKEYMADSERFRVFSA